MNLKNIDNSDFRRDSTTSFLVKSLEQKDYEARAKKSFISLKYKAVSSLLPLFS